MIKQDNRIENKIQTNKIELLKQLLESPSKDVKKSSDDERTSPQSVPINSSVVINITGDNNQIAAHGTASKPASDSKKKGFFAFATVLLLFF